MCNRFILQGPTYEHIVKVRKTNVSPALITYYKEPLVIHRGRMQWLWDHTGKRYLDMFAGIVTVSVGHCHPYVSCLQIFHICSGIEKLKHKNIEYTILEQCMQQLRSN